MTNSSYLSIGWSVYICNNESELNRCTRSTSKLYRKRTDFQVRAVKIIRPHYWWNVFLTPPIRTSQSHSTSYSNECKSKRKKWYRRGWRFDLFIKMSAVRTSSLKYLFWHHDWFQSFHSSHVYNVLFFWGGACSPGGLHLQFAWSMRHLNYFVLLSSGRGAGCVHRTTSFKLTRQSIAFPFPLFLLYVWPVCCVRVRDMLLQHKVLVHFQDSTSQSRSLHVSQL